MNGEFQVQIGEYKKLLDIRSGRIQKLEIQVREAAYSQVQAGGGGQALSEKQMSATSVHTPSGSAMFEVHVQKVQLTKECLLAIGSDHPPLFATWTFYEHDMQVGTAVRMELIWSALRELL